ncbi:hypothetical protein D9V28_02405 [Mycetocola zhadangensis]|uniref:Bacteriocin biosynthesis cyclodehydratase domain-containing protein n=1 Tax=Mycetocola zhadangensis TaxID=1164595 RepID=A0A3L7J5F6_9MICO|nr:hypothetical protein D9V28_02405 [Mycetocola zhadangensis]
MSCMLLRLDPRYPVVWRDTTSLQIGAETPVATLSNVSRPLEQVIGALMAGISRPQLERLASRLGLESEELATFLERISPALVSEPTKRKALGWVVDGSGLTADRIASLLTGTEPTPRGSTGAANITLAILVANHVIDPRRYIRWLSRDIPHLAVIYTDTGARVGPLVEPGAGPCLHCLARQAAEHDAAWPAIASQLLGQGAASEREPLVSTVAGLAARVAEAHLAGAKSELTFSSVSFDAHSPSGRRVEHRQHPDCGCRSLSGNGSAPSAGYRGLAAPPTTGTAAIAPG